MNRIGKENFIRNLAILQVTDEEDTFKEKHSHKLKALYWVIATSIILYTLETIAHELAMKLAGVH